MCTGGMPNITADGDTIYFHLVSSITSRLNKNDFPGGFGNRKLDPLM